MPGTGCLLSLGTVNRTHFSIPPQIYGVIRADQLPVMAILKKVVTNRRVVHQRLKDDVHEAPDRGWITISGAITLFWDVRVPQVEHPTQTHQASRVPPGRTVPQSFLVMGRVALALLR